MLRVTATNIFLGLVIIVGLCAPSSHATILYYGGDPESDGACRLNQRNFAAPDSYWYDDINVPAGTKWEVSDLTAITVYNVDDHGQLNSPTNTEAYYEIRSGVSVGDGGILLSAGTVQATPSYFGAGYGGYNTFDIDAQLQSPLQLNPGIYWICLAPVGNGDDSSYTCQTTGANGTGATIGDGSSYFSYTGGPQFAAEPYNLSYGVEGTAVPLPEPRELGLLLTAILWFGTRRSRKVPSHSAL